MSTAAPMTDEVVGMLRDSAADFLNGRHRRARMKGAVGRAPAVDRALWREMADLGWLALSLPESAGGSGLGLSAAATLAELFGRELLPEPFIAAAVMPAVVLGPIADEPATAALARHLVSGERVLGLAWQERVGELDPRAPATRYENGRLFGAKCFVPAVEDDSILLVSAQAQAQTVLVAVDLSAAGVAIERQAAGVTSLSRVTFDAAPVLQERPLLQGAQAEAALCVALEAGRVCAAAGLAGLAAASLEKTLDYVRTRVQFGRPIGSFQAIQHRCVDLHIACALAGASWREALRRFEAESQAAATAAAISAAKLRCGESALKVCREAVQMHGAMGFTEEADIGLYLRAAVQGAAWLGGAVDHRRRFLALHATTETADA